MGSDHGGNEQEAELLQESGCLDVRNEQTAHDIWQKAVHAFLPYMEDKKVPSVAVLLNHGLPDEIASVQEALELVQDYLPRARLPLDKYHAADSLLCELETILTPQFEVLRREAELLVAALEDWGWRYDPKVKKFNAVLLPGVGNKRKELLNAAIEQLCEEFDVQQNTESERLRIAKRLSYFFPPEAIDHRSRGPIWNAVNNWLATRVDRPAK